MFTTILWGVFTVGCLAGEAFIDAKLEEGRIEEAVKEYSGEIIEEKMKEVVENMKF